MTVVVWFLVAASVAVWARRVMQAPPVAPVQAGVAVVAAAPVASPAELLRLLGAAGASNSVDAAPPGDSARFRLLGVIADPRGHARGVALIALDQQPARPFRVGARVDGELLLQSVGTRSASLGGKQGAALFTLALPSPSELPARAPGAVPAMPLAMPPAVPAQPGVAQLAPLLDPAAAALPVPASAAPSVRMAIPGEMVEPGRRRRLQSRGGEAEESGPR